MTNATKMATASSFQNNGGNIIPRKVAPLPRFRKPDVVE
jgi:hypothetical protein